MAVLGSNTLNHSDNLLIQRAGSTKLTVTSTGTTVDGDVNATTFTGYGGGLTNLQLFAAGGGNEADLTTAFENRLNVNFTATGPRVVVIGHASYTEGTAAAQDFFLRIIIRDTVVSVDIAVYEGVSSNGPFGLAGKGRVTASVAFGGLILGRTYNARLEARKTQAHGPSFPYAMRIDGIIN